MPISCCGLFWCQPSLWTAVTGVHFSHASNRVCAALHRAGIMSYGIDASAGYRAADRWCLIEQGIGITNLVNRATARADEATPSEVATQAESMLTRLLRLSPRPFVKRRCKRGSNSSVDRRRRTDNSSDLASGPRRPSEVILMPFKIHLDEMAVCQQSFHSVPSFAGSGEQSFDCRTSHWMDRGNGQ